MLHFWLFVNLCNFLSVALWRLGKSEAYVCSLYMTTKRTSIPDELCYRMFCQSKQKHEMLPPTTDCLLQHLEHSNYQAFGWGRALEVMRDLGSLEGHGWMRDWELHVLLPITKAPAPVSLLELMTCKCKTSSCQQHRTCLQRNVLLHGRRWGM